MGLAKIKWQDVAGEDVLLSRKDGEQIALKNAVAYCYTPVAEYLIRREAGKFVVNYGGRTENSYDTLEAAKDWAENQHYHDKMQPWLEPDLISDYFNKFTQWSTDRQIIQNGNTLAQGLKLVSEIGELADNLAKGYCIADDIGDCMVVLNNLVHMTELTLEQCLAQAWGDIKDRKGYMNGHGVFIKEGDNS